MADRPIVQFRCDCVLAQVRDENHQRRILQLDAIEAIELGGELLAAGNKLAALELGLEPREDWDLRLPRQVTELLSSVSVNRAGVVRITYPGNRTELTQVRIASAWRDSEELFCTPVPARGVAVHHLPLELKREDSDG